MADHISEKNESSGQSPESPLSLQLSSINAELLQNRSQTPGGWLADNVLKPAVNTALIEPHNAITSPVNDAGKTLGASDSLLTDWTTYDLPQAKLFSPEWFAQNVSSGLAMVVPYGLASLGARAALRNVGARLELKGTMADVFKNKTTATIVGATVYDGLRKPKENETRLGNAIGGAAGFSIFEGGNHLSKDLKGGHLLLARAFTGMIGATSQHTLSTFVATSELPDKEHLLSAAASGATMNIVLPKINEKLGDFANAANVAMGKGVPIEVYLKQLALREGKDPLSSPTLASLAEQHPFARVQEAQGRGDSRDGNLVRLEPGRALPERLGHELSHMGKSPEPEARFQQAARALAVGDMGAARAAFMEARLLQEIAARNKEQNISQELSGTQDKATPVSIADAAKILAETASNGNSYALNFEAEFTAFVESKGTLRPTEDYRPFQDNSPQSWQKRQLSLSSTDADARLSILANLKDAPQSQVRSIWSQLLKDSDPRVRLACVDAIADLPAAQRLNSWFDAIASGDPQVRAHSLSKIGLLPAADRITAWKHAFNQQSVLAGLRFTELPEGKSAADLLVAAIEALPSKQREQAWTDALNDSRTQSAARENVSVLPESARIDAWQLLARHNLAPADTLAKQIPTLEAGDQLSAWRTLLAQPRGLNGEVAARQMRHIPAESLSALQVLVAEMPRGDLQRQLAKSLPLWKLSTLPMDSRVAVMQKVFATAEAHPQVFLPETMRHWWWHLLPENGIKDPTVIEHSQPLKERLAETLPAKQLAEIIFPEQPELAAQLSATAPESVRTIAARYQQSSPSTNAAMEAISKSWLQERSLSSAVSKVLELPRDANSGRDNPLTDLIAGLAKASDKSQQQAAIDLLAARVMSHPDQAETALAISLAAPLRAVDQAHFDAKFLRVLENEINSGGENFKWKLDAASELARMSREGRLGDAQFQLPQLRMPAVEMPLAEQSAIRNRIENALLGGDGIARVIDEGVLDRLLPNKLSREQALETISNIRQNPEFSKLSSPDQVNLLWAALLDSSGKRPGKAIDPGYEWSSTRIAYGVLSSLGYPVERVQRIATLMSRHSEAGLAADRNAPLAPEQLRELATYYRHPEAISQIDILNQAKQKVETGIVNAEAQRRFAEIKAALELARKELQVPDMPILFSQLAPGFGLRTMGGDWRLLVHTSGELAGGSFFPQLSLIESPNYSVSGSMVTPRHSHLYSPEARMVAILSGPSENISLAAREAMTGTGVDWVRHVQQTINAAPEMLALAQELNAALAKNGSGPRSLADLFRESSRFDNLDQIPAGSSLRQALDLVATAMTREADGKPLGTHNEVKLNNPTMVGLGVYRRGQGIFFEGMDAASRLKLLGDSKAPSWLSSRDGGNVTTVPASVWQAAQKRNLPIVVLDP